MVNIFSFINNQRKKRMRRKKDEEDMRKSEHIRWKAILGARLSKARDDMLQRRCPQNNFRMCDKECAHFSAGFAFKSPVSSSKNMLVYPRCKLWR